MNYKTRVVFVTLSKSTDNNTFRKHAGKSPYVRIKLRVFTKELDYFSVRYINNRA